MKTVSLIPQPLTMEFPSGTFTLTPETTILVSEDTYAVGKHLAQHLMPPTGFLSPEEQELRRLKRKLADEIPGTPKAKQLEQEIEALEKNIQGNM